MGSRWHTAASALAMTLISGSGYAGDKDPNADPFGVTIGLTTCEQAAKILRSSVVALSETWVVVEAISPMEFFGGATRLEAKCRRQSSPVEEVTLFVRKEGAGSSSTVSEVSKTLANKYKSMDATPSEIAGNELRYFRAANALITLANFPGTRDFMVTYWSEWLVNKNRDHREQDPTAERKKAGSL